MLLFPNKYEKEINVICCINLKIITKVWQEIKKVHRTIESKQAIFSNQCTNFIRRKVKKTYKRP